MKATLSSIIIVLLLSLTCCDKTYEDFEVEYHLLLDRPSHFTEENGTDTIRYDIEGGLSPFIKSGGYVQIRAEDANRIAVQSQGAGWVVIKTTGTGAIQAEAHLYMNGQHEVVRFKVFVSPHQIIYMKWTSANQSDIFICKDDGTQQSNLTNTPFNSERCPVLSSSGSMYGYVRQGSYYIFSGTDTVYQRATTTAPQNMYFFRDETGFMVLEDLYAGPQIVQLDNEVEFPFYVPFPPSTYQFFWWNLYANSMQTGFPADYVAIEARAPAFTNNNPSFNAEYNIWDSKDESGTFFYDTYYPGKVTYAEISPNGKYLAFSALAGSFIRIYLVNRTDHSVLTAISPATSNCNYPTFNAMSNRIAFSSDANGNFDLYTMKLDGTDIIQITSSPEDETNPAWR